MTSEAAKLSGRYQTRTDDLFLVREDRGVLGVPSAAAFLVDIRCGATAFTFHQPASSCSSFRRFADHARTRRGPNPVDKRTGSVASAGCTVPTRAVTGRDRDHGWVALAPGLDQGRSATSPL